MPRKGIPTNWKAAEHSTALAGVVKTMQSNLLNGSSVGQFKEDFLSQVVELAIALKWDEDLASDLAHGRVEPTPHPVRATIVEQPKTSGITGYFGGRK